MDFTPSDGVRLGPADREILRYLRDERADYLPILANRLGMHLGYVERRCALLVDCGLVEPISDEVVYRVTDLGVRYLEGDVGEEAIDPAGSD